MDLQFRERTQVREYAQRHGKKKLEEELDSGRLDLRSTLLVEQWLDDEPLRRDKRRKRALNQLWTGVAYGVCALGVVGLAVLFYLMKG